MFELKVRSYMINIYLYGEFREYEVEIRLNEVNISL